MSRWFFVFRMLVMYGAIFFCFDIVSCGYFLAFIYNELGRVRLLLEYSPSYFNPIIGLGSWGFQTLLVLYVL